MHLFLPFKQCLALEAIDGLVLSFMYGPEMARMFGGGIENPEAMLQFVKKNGRRRPESPLRLSFFAERRYIEQLKAIDVFPVFNDPVESVRALGMLRSYWRQKNISVHR